MYSILTKIFALFSFFVIALAVPMPVPGDSGSSTSQCNTGPLQCCQSVQQAGSMSTTLAGLLGVPVDLLNLPFGFDCSPVTGGGIGLGATCAAIPVCCSDNSNSKISLGCLPVQLVG